MTGLLRSWGTGLVGLLVSAGLGGVLQKQM